MLWDVRCYKVKQFECFHFAVKRRWGSHVRIKLFIYNIWIIYSVKPKHMNQNCEFARMWILYNIRCKNLAKMQAMGQVLDIVGILQLTILHFKAESLIEFNLLCVSNSIVRSMTNIYPAYIITWHVTLTQLSAAARDWGVQTQWCVLPRPQLLNTNPDCWILVCRLTNSASLIPPDLLVIRNSAIQVNFNAFVVNNFTFYQ